MKLHRDFFNRPTLTVAKELLGKNLCRRLGDKVIQAKITETEAYCGPHDLASHASKGLTKRTKIMFGPPGRVYVYMIYGMYHCFNVVTRERGCPEAVLIRGCELATGDWRLATRKRKKPLVASGYSLMAKLNGPGKLCRELKINKSLNGVDLCKSNEIWAEDSKERQPKIKRGKRIGVDYAGKWKDKLWRFFL